jgi:hypothetical protein
LPRDAAREVLRRTTVWDPPQEGAIHLWIAATEAGERAYFSGALAGSPAR